MRTKFLAALAVVLFCGAESSAAQPAMGTLPGYFGKSTSCAGYVGPGDINAYVEWVGLRAYSCAQAAAHANVIQLCAQVDTTCAAAEIETAATNGTLSLGTIGAACNNSTNICIVPTLYQQAPGGSGCNIIQATGGQRPTFIPGTINSKPALKFIRASSQFLLCAPLAFVNAVPETITWIAQRTATFTSQSTIFSLQTSGNNAPSDAFSTTANAFWMFNGTAVRNVTAADSAWHVEVSVYNNATTPGAILDGTATTLPGSPGNGGGATTGYSVGSNQPVGNHPDMLFLEAGHIASALTTAQGQAINSNAVLYYPALP